MLKRVLTASVVLALTTTSICAGALEGLPHYQPEQKVAGTIRNFGYSLGGMMPIWEEAVGKYQPDIRFEDKFPSGDVAIAGLVSGVADLGPQGRELVLTEYLAFFETFHYYPTAITVMTGAYDVEGMACGLVVYVNKDNPISKLTMKQLDGIFGSERVAGLRGFKWTLAAGRSAQEDIRPWGQLGLTGEWADKPIHTYGPPGLYPGGVSFFQTRVMGGADTWNESLMEFDDRAAMLRTLAGDRYGIAYAGNSYRTPQVKALALAEKAGGTFVALT